MIEQNNKELFRDEVKVSYQEVSSTASKELSSSARESLNRLLRENSIPFKSLEIESHLYLKSNKNCLVSLSHTKNLVAAAVCTSDRFKSIGVDIEWTTREINPRLEKFFRNDEDQNLSALKLWCMKESAFKAISPLRSDLTVLNSLWIRDCEFGEIGVAAPLGQVSFEQIRVSGKSFYLSVAAI